MAWTDPSPVREELFGIERLEQHAQSLAAAQGVTARPPRVFALRSRLHDNARALLVAYRASAAEIDRGHSVVPAAEWLLDNYHLVEKQVREIRDSLPPDYYRQLPKLAAGPFAGYPRVFGLAWAYVAHTDSHVDIDSLRRFILAYQRVQPLTIGELWAVAITLRIVLIENLRRLSDQITSGRSARADADHLASRLLSPGAAERSLEQDIASRSKQPLSELFAAQLVKRLRDRDPLTMPALGWLRERLARQSSSPEAVVLRAQQRLGASNVSVRNVITSMRLMSDMDWAALFESVSLVDEALGASSAFGSMDFVTRNLYRSAIEELARGSACSELDIAHHAIAAARTAGGKSSGHPSPAPDPVESERAADPGYHLLAAGRTALERTIDFHPPLRLRASRWHRGRGPGGYIGGLCLVTASMLAGVAAVMPAVPGHTALLALWLLILALPVSEVAMAAINRLVAWRFGAMPLPALELADGIPASLRTLVAVPTLLGGEDELIEQIERLEVHYLSAGRGDLVFALLLDGVDCTQAERPGDTELLTRAARAIETLNVRHGPSAGGPRFLMLHRRRVFDATQQCWMGWERKRGKLHELNRLLRGATDTTFVALDGSTPAVPSGVRYVLTLDADTRLPRDAALRLVGKMAHSLNRPRFDPALQRVVGGYAILQPRVTPSLPLAGLGSFYQWISSGPGGMDPYAMPVSDVYQDLFGEGSYTGKGIYDIDAFESALAGRVPDDTLLSHDLLEGLFARAGLASDIELVEDAPARYDVGARRLHRWTRGDWQLLPWVTGRHIGITALGRWKLLDNLRRSALVPFTMAALVCGWLLPWPAAGVSTLMVLATLALPAFLPAFGALRPSRVDIRWHSRLASLASDVRMAGLQTLLAVVFLADRTWRTMDAVLRTLARLHVTRRHLLEWTTSAQSAQGPRLTLAGFYRQMGWGCALGCAMGLMALLLSVAPGLPVGILIVSFVSIWLVAPAVALEASRPPKPKRQLSASPEQNRALRQIARETWRYFETFVSPQEHMLPPDNFQEDPKPTIAHRTSPTNIGLYLLAAVSARDFGWAGTRATATRLEQTFDTLATLTRWRGHFYNWYDTRSLQALEPAYVSSVDSGNFAGHLIALANACDEWQDGVPSPMVRQGLQDTLRLARRALDDTATPGSAHDTAIRSALDGMDRQLEGSRGIAALAPAISHQARKAAHAARTLQPAESAADLVFWLEALANAAAEHASDIRTTATAADTPDASPPLQANGPLALRLQALAATARKMAGSMDFAVLLDGQRKLLSIGLRPADHSLDENCYDLLASEARLASLFAIAKGDAPTKHWFRLDRTAIPVGSGSALVSWSGSMFEYLMPSLVMRAPAGSLLEQTSRLAVQRQMTYARALRLPWGISESSYNARDLSLTYQYSNFGVPGLGLKRGLSDNWVIAPYATGLATMVDLHAACRNFEHLATWGARGRYGFYEALDFTPQRLPEGETVAIVRSYMAHHQGMTIVAIGNALHDAQMRSRFHREPMIQACELLLQERVPRNVATEPPRAEQVHASHEADAPAPSVRRLDPFERDRQPVTQLLSNGRYAVMLTASGGGYSRWQGLAITRWREDATRDPWGAFVYLRDVASGQAWSATAQPLPGAAEPGQVVFGEDYASYSRLHGHLGSVLDVLVSGEHDGEVRRLTLNNHGRKSCEIDVTSFAEIVLGPAAADQAHPAFSKLFVITEYLPEFGALIATRRPRSPEDTPVWAAHFAVVDGELTAEPQHESDRARFMGRGRGLADARVIRDGRPLSNTTGTVLDPVFALRRRVRIEPGGLARMAFWTMVASSREQLLDLIDQHHEHNAFERAKTLAWTQAQVQLRHLGIHADEAADFQRLAAALLYSDRRFRPGPDALRSGAGPQSGLWTLGVSGDRPIVLLRIDDTDDLPQVRQLLRAHEYWRMKQVSVDLVVLNERSSSYVQDLQVAIETAVRSPRFVGEASLGSVYTLRADLLSVETRSLLQSVARVVLLARRGSIAEQLLRLTPATGTLDTISPLPAMASSVMPAGRQSGPRPWRTAQARHMPIADLDTGKLEFFNGLGGFGEQGREYIVRLTDGATTPMPWINVVANPAFGFHVSADGSGYTWAENSRENQLTPWSNDPVGDPCGEAFYVRDMVGGALWTPTAQPLRDEGVYVARHGQGYSRFDHQADGIAMALIQYVPRDDPVKISRLTLHNRSARPRQLSVTAYAEWVLGPSRAATAPFIATAIDPLTGALLACNSWSNAYPGRVAFADLGGQHTTWTADRSEFLGHLGSPGAPGLPR